MSTAGQPKTETPFRGEAKVRRANELDERDPHAHCSLFCTLGEELRIEGEDLASIFGYRRMMRELERTLERDSDDLDALSPKGTFLIQPPSLVAGDGDKEESFLRWVINRAPESVKARLSLTKSSCARGIHDQAIELASEALALAQAQRLTDFVIEIQAALASARINLLSCPTVLPAVAPAHS